MNPKQRSIVRRLRKLMVEAEKADLVTFCDVHAWGIRLVPKDELVSGTADPRDLGEVVDVPDEGPTGQHVRDLGEVISCESTCGTPSGPKNGIPVM